MRCFSTWEYLTSITDLIHKPTAYIWDFSEVNYSLVAVTEMM